MLDFFGDGEEDPYQWKDNLRYVGDLVTHGHADAARTLLERQISFHGLSDRGVLEAAMRFDSGSPIEDFGQIPSKFLEVPGVLALAYDLRSKGPAHQDLFAASLAAVMKQFPRMDVYSQDSLLRVLTVKDLLSDLGTLVPDLRDLPDPRCSVLDAAED